MNLSLTASGLRAQQARIEVTLDRGRTTRLGPERTPHTLCVRNGRLWITVDGDPADYVLEMGEKLRLPRGKAAVVQALAPSAFSLTLSP